MSLHVCIILALSPLFLLLSKKSLRVSCPPPCPLQALRLWILLTDSPPLQILDNSPMYQYHEEDDYEFECNLSHDWDLHSRRPMHQSIPDNVSTNVLSGTEDEMPCDSFEGTASHTSWKGDQDYSISSSDLSNTSGDCVTLLPAAVLSGGMQSGVCPLLAAASSCAVTRRDDCVPTTSPFQGVEELCACGTKFEMLESALRDAMNSTLRSGRLWTKTDNKVRAVYKQYSQEMAVL